MFLHLTYCVSYYNFQAKSLGHPVNLALVMNHIRTSMSPKLISGSYPLSNPVPESELFKSKSCALPLCYHLPSPLVESAELSLFRGFPQWQPAGLLSFKGRPSICAVNSCSIPVTKSGLLHNEIHSTGLTGQSCRVLLVIIRDDI